MTESQHEIHEHVDRDSSGNEQGHGTRRGRHVMMLACCVPMLLIAIVLVVTHVVSASALVFVLACTVMMAFMMRGMNHDHGGH